MAEYTPGPWKGDGRYVFAGEIVVAQCYITKGDGERETNAHFIATAPDMEEALETTVTYQEKMFKTFPDTAIDPVWIKIMENNRAILAKARGES